MIIIILSVVGILIGLYSYFLEQKIKSFDDYKPICDISDKISCSKPIKSKYSNLFFISNSLLAIGYYCLIIILRIFRSDYFLTFVSLFGVAVSLYFAYLLFFKIRTFCLVCVCLYIINFLIFIFAVRYFLIF